MHKDVVGNPSSVEAFMCFVEEEISDDWKAVISMSHDIFKHITTFEPSSGANAVVKYCSRGV